MAWSRDADGIPERTRHARTLFDGLAQRYERPAAWLSFGQYGRWRRFAVDRLALPRGAVVLDVGTGTGLVARDLARRHGLRIIGVDQSVGMLAAARSHAADVPGYRLVGAQAERLPFPDASLAGIAFTYVLRYVEDPWGTLAEMARVLKPGAPMVSVEFGAPRGIVTRPLWRLYALRVLPLLGRLISPDWRSAGEFLGGSIMGFCERYPPDRLEALWRRAGITAVRTRSMSFGAGVVTWGRKAP